MMKQYNDIYTHFTEKLQRLSNIFSSLKIVVMLAAFKAKCPLRSRTKETIKEKPLIQQILKKPTMWHITVSTLGVLVLFVI